jgi:hypothetical protein
VRIAAQTFVAFGSTRWLGSNRSLLRVDLASHPRFQTTVRSVGEALKHLPDFGVVVVECKTYSNATVKTPA